MRPTGVDQIDPARTDDAMIRNLFFNSGQRLRNGWWIAIFLALLAAMLFPLILIAAEHEAIVPLYQQLAIIAAATLICQLLRRKPVTEVTGAFDSRWMKEAGSGAGLGFTLMAAPAAFLALTGAITWSGNTNWQVVIGPTLLTLALAAAAEELLFRGFVFQRLAAGLGVWPAQLLIAALFTLTHSDALAAQGALGYLAGANIFVASLLFGWAYLRTRSLALPFGLHFAANATQGPLLGFGVSGGEAPGVLSPIHHGASDWLTGGSFGLEASLAGFVCVVAATVALWRWRRRKTPSAQDARD
jgi:membrane protease YdiL (CAAX protease family)